MLSTTIKSKSKKRHCPLISKIFFENVTNFVQPLSGIPFGKFNFGMSKASMADESPELSSVKQMNLEFSCQIP